MDFNEGQCENSAIELKRKPDTLRESLEHKKHLLQEELNKVTKGLELLDKHPEIEHFMDIVGNALNAKLLRY